MAMDYPRLTFEDTGLGFVWRHQARNGKQTAHSDQTFQNKAGATGNALDVLNDDFYAAEIRDETDRGEDISRKPIPAPEPTIADQSESEATT